MYIYIYIYIYHISYIYIPEVQIRFVLRPPTCHFWTRERPDPTRGSAGSLGPKSQSWPSKPFVMRN